jgi:hypothetical protein
MFEDLLNGTYKYVNFLNENIHIAKKNAICARPEVLKDVIMKSTIFWGMMPCSLVKFSLETTPERTNRKTEKSN